VRDPPVVSGIPGGDPASRVSAASGSKPSASSNASRPMSVHTHPSENVVTSLSVEHGSASAHDAATTSVQKVSSGLVEELSLKNTSSGIADKTSAQDASSPAAATHGSFTA